MLGTGSLLCVSGSPFFWRQWLNWGIGPESGSARLVLSSATVGKPLRTAVRLVTGSVKPVSGDPGLTRVHKFCLRGALLFSFSRFISVGIPNFYLKYSSLKILDV